MHSVRACAGLARHGRSFLWIFVLSFTACAVAVAAVDTPPLAAADPGAGREISFEEILGWMVDLDRLPILEDGIRCAQASSYDPRSRVDPDTGEKLQWNANGDSGHYRSIDPETGEAVMADLQGPGCIFRIWSANPQGMIRFYLDGDETPTYEFPFREIFTGQVAPFAAPLAWARDDGGRASCFYFPIPFAKSCRVTADAAHGQYYHIGYQLFPASWTVESFHLPLDEAEQAELARVTGVLNRPGEDPQPRGRVRSRSGTIEVAPGGEVRFLAERGPATVTRFHVRIESGEKAPQRTLWLTVHYDREEVPSVAAPLGDFFGASFLPGPYASLPLAMTEEGYTSLWRMPFRQSAEFFLRNDGTKPTRIAWEASVRPERDMPLNIGAFHAKWRREPTGGTFDYPFLECVGRGRFVGAALFIDNLHGGWWGEGDEKFTVDGEAFPSTFGTGTEDYFGDAWGIRHFVNPYHGCPVTVGRAQSCYRWHITDFVPFTRSFEATIENYAFEGETPNDYASMAYWYQVEPSDDFFGHYPVVDRRPLPPRIEKNAAEAEGWFNPAALPDGVTIVADEDVDYPLSGGRGARIVGAPGAAFACRVLAPRTDRYALNLEIARGFEGTARLAVTGSEGGDTVYLAEGGNDAVLTLTGDPGPDGAVVSIVDFARLEPVRQWIRGWRICGPFDNTDDIGRETVYPPETELDLGAAYTGKDDREVRWIAAAAGDDGVVSLMDLPNAGDYAVGYAYARIHAPEAMKARLLLASDDGVKVWLNGEVVHVNQVLRGMGMDTDEVALPLRAGANDLLMKIDQGEGDWVFRARLVDPTGTLRTDAGP